MEMLLLPGMDGTGRLFAPFQEALGRSLVPRIASYPTETSRSYQELLDDISLPNDPFSIVAESFSGPLGIWIAKRHADRVCALILVASFARNPSRLARWMGPLVNERLFRPSLPDIALRFGLLGMDASRQEVAALRLALESVRPEVLAGRLREIVAVDVRGPLATLSVPVLYVAGTRDRLVGSKTVSELQRLKPDMVTTSLDAPHLVLQRKPDEAARKVEEFLAKRVS